MAEKPIMNVLIRNKSDLDICMRMLEKYIPELTWGAGSKPTEFNPYSNFSNQNLQRIVSLPIYRNMKMYYEMYDSEDGFLRSLEDDPERLGEIIDYKEGYIIKKSESGLYYGPTYNKESEELIYI